VKDVSEESEIEETRAKYSGSCSTRGVRIVVFGGLKGGEMGEMGTYCRDHGGGW
jgi:hypothetical protein